MTAKEYLEQVHKNDIEVQHLKHRLEVMKDTAESVRAVSYGGTKIQTTPESDRIGTFCAKIDELERIINDKILSAAEFKMRVLDEIYQLADDRYSGILCQRYIYMKPWKEIAADKGYNYKYLFHLNGQALNEFAKLFQDKLDNVA